MRIGIGTAFIVVIVAEMIAVNSGSVTASWRPVNTCVRQGDRRMIAIGLLGSGHRCRRQPHQQPPAALASRHRILTRRGARLGGLPHRPLIGEESRDQLGRRHHERPSHREGHGSPDETARAGRRRQQGFRRTAWRGRGAQRHRHEIRPGEFVCLLGPSGCGNRPCSTPSPASRCRHPARSKSPASQSPRRGRIAAWCFRNMRCFRG